MDELTSTVVAYYAIELADQIAENEGIILGPTDGSLCDRALRYYAKSLLEPPAQAKAA
jgi:hypothetical protein